MVSSFISSINSPTSLSFHAIPRDFRGDFCGVFCFPLSAMLSESGSICTCSPKSVLTEGAKAHQRKVGSARLIVYTAHLIRAGLDFQDRVTVLSVLRLLLDMVRARVKFWSGTDGAKSFTRLNLSVPNQFFWYAYFFHPSRAKNFRPCKWGFRQMISQPEFHADIL